jgi:tetratricopeptide (TPR) repeat protein
MLYIKNLKAVDYSILYTNHIAKKEWILTGTTADKETSISEGVMAEHVIKYTPYKDFLIEGLTKFSKNDYKGSLGHLLTILQQYPDDVNASFYSGLCYYNLGKTRQAISMFDKTIGNSITTFKEESEWYKSLSLLEDGKKSDAKELMKKIESEGGFYAKAAREKLKGMK